MKAEIKIFSSDPWSDYELLDTGVGEKLERFGKYSFIRPYLEAVWPTTLKTEWQKVTGKFWSSKTGAKSWARLASASDASRGGWKMEYKIKSKWEMSYKDIKFWATPTPFRHLSFFPEQASHWDFIENKIKERIAGPDAFVQVLGSPAQSSLKERAQPDHSQKHTGSASVKFLNLFGYTGVASLFALRAGAEVTHVDASKQSLAAAKENQKLSGLENLPMRIIEDDVLKFIEREAKRGNKYDAVIMDPPKFGRGPKGEIWKLEEKLPQLLEGVRKILSDKPLFVILTSYATDSSALPLGYALEETMKNFNGNVEAGELCVLEKSNNRHISLANTAVWTSN